MATLSLCMIVRDEAELLERCLASVQGVVDEIVVVDTGSLDETPAIARRLGARVIPFAWVEDFSKARNVGLDAATGDWILVLDADEVLLEAGREPLRAALAGPHAAYMLPLENLTGEARAALGNRVMLVRLFRRDPRVRFAGRVHEQVTSSLEAIGGTVGVCDAPLRHDGYLTERIRARDKHARNLSLLEAELREAPDDPYALYQLGKTLVPMNRSVDAKAAFERALEVLVGESRPGTVAFYPRLYAHLALLVEADDRPRALKWLEAGLERLPTSPELRLHRARLLFEEGEFALASGEAGRACVLAMEARVAGYDRAGLVVRAATLSGDALQRLGQRQEALVAWRLAARMAPPDQAEPWLRLANALMQASENAEALEAYRVVVARDPDQLSAYLALATLAFERAEWAEVRRALEAAERLKPGMAEVAALSRLCRQLSGL